MEWELSTPGVVELPGGRRVRGRRVRTTPAVAAERTLFLTLRRPRGSDDGAWICWPDFALPIDRSAATREIRRAWDLSADHRVEVACGGGVGRTGTALAAMAMLDGLDPDAAIAWIRAHYHPRAVETPWQRSWLRSW